MLLQKNPLTMRGTLTRCWLFTYRTPVANAQRLLPPPLEPVTHGGYAFWNIVVSEIRGMRPSPLPAFIGVNYWHVGYRLYVRYHPANSEPIEGLWFARSDCDSRLMSIAGNLVTDFNFHTAPIRVESHDGVLAIAIESRDAPARARLLPSATPQLPRGSAFGSLDEAAAFLKYKPYGISIGARGDANVVRITREEAAWRGKLVQVESEHWSFFDGQDAQPEICYEVAPIVYQWNRGRVYRSRR
jgi:hypothetical protein